MISRCNGGGRYGARPLMPHPRYASDRSQAAEIPFAPLIPLHPAVCSDVTRELALCRS